MTDMTSTTTKAAETIEAYDVLADGRVALHPAQIFRSLGIVKVCTNLGVSTFRLGDPVPIGEVA